MPLLRDRGQCLFLFKLNIYILTKSRRHMKSADLNPESVSRVVEGPQQVIAVRYRELVLSVAAFSRKGGPARFAAVVAVVERADDGGAADRVPDAATEAGAFGCYGLSRGGDGGFGGFSCHRCELGMDGSRFSGGGG